MKQQRNESDLQFAADPHRSADSVVAWLRQQTAADCDLFVTDHGLQTLIPLGTQEEVEISDELLDLLSQSAPFEYDGFFWAVSHDALYPVVVARSQLSEAVGFDTAHVGELIHHRSSRFEALASLRRRESMSTAAQLQWEQLPVKTIAAYGYEAAGTLAPAYDVAGDVFDLALDTNDHLNVIAMDAMGHGTAATLSAVLALSAVRNTRRQGANLLEQVAAANTAVFDQFGGDRFVTMVAAVITGDGVIVVNCGHEPIRRGDHGGVSSLDLDADRPLGIESDPDFRLQTLPALVEGEIMCLSSDGASQATDAQGQRFGNDRLNSVIAGHSGRFPLTIVNRIAREISEHSNRELSDDVTCVAVSTSRFR